MTLGELLQYLDAHTNHDFLAGEVAESLTRAQNGEHPDPIAGEILAGIAEGCGAANTDAEVERSQVVNSIGPLRLKYQADDAPVEGFRLMRETVLAIDAAFDQEAIQQKTGEAPSS
ncbi:MAG: hypothetical protein ACQERG_00590 [Pseudomonadota bacterium]